MTVEETMPLYVSPIADPLLSGKLEAKALKLVKKAHGAKAIRRGVPEITKLLRKGKKGIVIFAANIFPVDLVAHLPILCEEKDVFYAYVSAREILGEALNSKRAVSVAFIPTPLADSAYEKYYNEVLDSLKQVHPYMGEGKKMPEEEPSKEKKEEEEKKEKPSKRAAETDADAEEPPKKKKKKSKKEAKEE